MGKILRTVVLYLDTKSKVVTGTNWSNTHNWNTKDISQNLYSSTSEYCLTVRHILRRVHIGLHANPHTLLSLDPPDGALEMRISCSGSHRRNLRSLSISDLSHI